LNLKVVEVLKLRAYFPHHELEAQFVVLRAELLGMLPPMQKLLFHVV